MHRREFLSKSVSAITAAGFACSPLTRAFASATDGNVDWALGWQSVMSDALPPLSMKIEGTLPSDINGSLLRNGPARFERGGQHLNHWFDGDGMVQRFAFAGGKVTHNGQFVHTERYVNESKAGRYLNHHAGTLMPDAKPARNNDSLNQANIALLEWDDELLALWEGGSAYRMDPESLVTLGRKTWREDLQNMPFSAHPLLEKDGSMWNLGFAPYGGKGGYVFVYHIAPKTGVKRVQPVALPFAGYIHDFAQTERHLILVIPPFHYDHGSGHTFVDRFTWSPQRGSKLLVIEKSDLSQQSWFDLPAGFVFHFGDAYQRGQELHINLSWYDDPTLMQSSIAQRIQQAHRPLKDQAFASTIVANLQTRRAELVKSDTVLEFPGFEQANTGPAPANIGLGVVESLGIRSDTLSKWDGRTGRSEHYRYEPHQVAEEPMFVGPRNSQGQSRYIVQTFLDLKTRSTGLHVFHSDAIEHGPVCTASMPRALPLGFHGIFRST